MRHEVTDCVQHVLDTQQRMASRDTLQDVGAEVSTHGEQIRTDLGDVAAASYSRAQQAARSLEECLKSICAESAAVVQRMRYRLYTLQKAMTTSERSRRVLRDVTIYAIVDGGPTVTDFQSHIDRLLAAGVDAIQLREKRLSDRALLERCHILSARAQSYPALAIINDRPDLAVLSGADGVHLGQADLSVASARRIVGAERLIGVSTHALAQAQQAVLDGADYLGVGPMFASTTKEFPSFAGPQTLGQIASQISLPLFAIGGIAPANIDQIVAAGGTRVALRAALRPQSADLQQIVDELRTALTGPVSAPRR
jgi:thiamine-phosphate pyrophosphorylase